MKRGCFRIIAGISMLAFTLVLFYAKTSYDDIVLIWYRYGNSLAGGGWLGVFGIVLWIAGARAYNKGLRSHLVLHSISKKLHTILKWITFVVSSLIFIRNLIGLLQEFYVDTVLSMFAALSLALYSVFYMYKKPSCLFSTTLLLVAMVYLHNPIFKTIEYIFSWNNGFNLALGLGLIRNIVGILYIVIAVKLYKEKFSVAQIKRLGWIAFVLVFVSEILIDIIYIVQAFGAYGFLRIDLVLSMAFTILIPIYICLLDIKTLQGITISHLDENARYCRKCGNKMEGDSIVCSQCGFEFEE